MAGSCMAQNTKGSRLSLLLDFGLDLRPQVSEVLNALYTRFHLTLNNSIVAKAGIVSSRILKMRQSRFKKFKKASKFPI